MQDLYNTDPKRGNHAQGHADYTAPTQQHELASHGSYRSGIHLPSLANLDHEPQWEQIVQIIWIRRGNRSYRSSGRGVKVSTHRNIELRHMVPHRNALCLSRSLGCLATSGGQSIPTAMICYGLARVAGWEPYTW